VGAVHSIISGKARSEHIPSGLPPRADIVDALWHFRFVPTTVMGEEAALVTSPVDQV
jgi:hypothetical protein